MLAQAIGVVASVSGDSFAVATIVPNSIYAVIAGGLLSAVLVPQIVRASSQPDGGQAYINKLVTLALIAFAIVTVAATLAAPLLMRLYGARNLDLATAFAYWCLPQVFFLGLYSLLGEVLNARRSFGPFTWAPVLNNVVGIASILTFVLLYGADQTGNRAASDWSPTMIALLAGGTTLGLAAQALILFLFWRRIGLKYRPDFSWRGVNLGTAGRAAGWTFAMLVANQVAGLAETRVASLASGQAASVLTLSTAWLIFMLPHSIITVSLVTAFYTRMSENASAGNLAGLRTDLSMALRTVGLVIVPATAILILVAYPFSRIFTQDYVDVSQMGNVVIAYLLGLVPFSLVFVMQRCFYALGDTRTPFLFTSVQVVLIVAGTIALGQAPVQFIALGVALLVTGTGILQLALAGIPLRRRIGAGVAARVSASLGIDLLAVLPAAALGFAVLLLLGGNRPDGFALAGEGAALLTMAAVGTVVLISYFGMLVLLRSRDLSAAIGPVVARLHRRSPRH